MMIEVESYKLHRKSGVCGEVLNRWHALTEGVGKRAVELMTGAVVG